MGYKMKYDIIIIGGGPAGLCFAKSLADTDLNIVIIEKQTQEALSNPTYDGREIALTHSSHKIMQNLGIWDLVPENKISLIKEAKVLNGNSPYALHFDHEEAGEDNLGFMLSNHVIKKAAFDSLDGEKNITLLTETEVLNVTTDTQKGTITLTDQTKIEAPLIIAADSRFSTTRRMMGISTSMLDFGRTCIVCKMQIDGAHNDTAYECFYFGRTLAVLPLNDNQVSIVITINSEETHNLLNMNKEEFAKDVERRTNGTFGAMFLSSELFPYPLVATFAKSFYTNRFAVIGDAAVGMHPVTAHGFNLGLQGANTLAQQIITAIKEGRDFSATTVLKNYDQKHRRASRPLFHGTNALVRLYTKETPAAKLARRCLLRLGNRIKPAKQLIINQLTERTS